MDWTAFSSLVGLIALLITLSALIYEIRQSRMSLQTSVLLGLTERLDSKEIRQLRKIAANKLILKEYPNSELSDVLDFFGTVAFLCDIKAIDNNLAYREFGWWMIRYWEASYDFIIKERKLDTQGWVTLEKTVKKLKERELRAGYSPECYTEESIVSFLREEKEKPQFID
jgi:hypothetical protein